MLKLAAVLSTLILPDATATMPFDRPVVEDPRWTRGPDDEVKEHLSPGFAMAIGVSGNATIQCAIREDGHPFICRVENESVPGLGFGSAARLIVASAEVRTRRFNGVPTRGGIITTVRFHAPGIGDRGQTWKGHTPTDEGLRLARQYAEATPGEAATIDDWMDGLDHDRRKIVRAWMEELFVPSPERLLDIRTVQLARLFSEAELQGMLEGSYPDWPSEEDWQNAEPEFSPQERAAIITLRDRYCARFECGAE